MGIKLSHMLLDEGFFSALGTVEHARGEVHVVRRRGACTWDINNGITIIYDEEARPWIRKGTIPVGSFNEEHRKGVTVFLADYDLRQGAYVPHSNDGGHFVREVMSTL